MNRFFLAFATLFTAGIFAYAYGKEWIMVKFLDKQISFTALENHGLPYFYQSKSLYLNVMFIFGAVFLTLWLATVFFILQKNRKMTFLCFVLTMLTIFAVMVNGAVK